MLVFYSTLLIVLSAHDFLKEAITSVLLCVYESVCVCVCVRVHMCS